MGRWALGTGLSGGGLQAQRFWNASGQRVLTGVGGQGLCWFEAGKLTVKFHCCLREGAQAVPSAPIQTPRGRPPPSPRWPPGMARGPPPQPYSLHSAFPFPPPLPGRCDPPPPPPPAHKAEPPLASCMSQLGGGHHGRGASALPPPNPRLLVLLTAALPRGGPLEETLVWGERGVLLPARPDMWPALCRGLMATGWARRTQGGHMGADLSPFACLSLPQGLRLLPAGASGRPCGPEVGLFRLRPGEGRRGGRAGTAHSPPGTRTKSSWSWEEATAPRWGWGGGG